MFCYRQQWLEQLHYTPENWVCRWGWVDRANYPLQFVRIPPSLPHNSDSPPCADKVIIHMTNNAAVLEMDLSDNTLEILTWVGVMKLYPYSRLMDMILCCSLELLALVWISSAVCYRVRVYKSTLYNRFAFYTIKLCTFQNFHFRLYTISNSNWRNHIPKILHFLISLLFSCPIFFLLYNNKIVRKIYNFHLSKKFFFWNYASLPSVKSSTSQTHRRF